MEIRKVKNDELKQVGEIANFSFDDYLESDFLKMSTDNNYEFLVFVDNNEVLGFVIFLKIDEKLEIIKIATDYSVRRTGVATKLIEFVKLFAKKYGHIGIILEVNEKNFSAQALYSKIGFKEISRRKKYYHNTDDAIIMEWLVK